MALPQGITGSTMPRRQLGRRLRDLRHRARMTTRVAARRLEWSEAKIWRIETGQTSLRSLDVEAMCKVYGAAESELEPLTALARETKARGWWSSYGDAIVDGFEVYIGLEEAATTLSTFENEFVPGLLQTADYTRALLASARPDLTPVEVDRRVEVRTTRQRLLTRTPDAVRLIAIIGESLLWRRIGDASVAAGQLAHLRSMCERPNIDIRLVPNDSGYHEGLDSGRFVLLEFGESGAADVEPPVVYVENFAGTAFFDKDHEIDRYRAAFANIRAASVDGRAALDEAIAAA
ncbi:helix-turn-helix domain-containing protein [Nocardia spumae]|uniref:helix-turn-helix domain-containing protein n=1 Tax=Nocardia spumae TaxID=2887190 RepID=UPI001D14831A|nr:helix-turn-helix transcriptional regulator [Nocardia spumae]